MQNVRATMHDPFVESIVDVVGEALGVDTGMLDTGTFEHACAMLRAHLDARFPGGVEPFATICNGYDDYGRCEWTWEPSHWSKTSKCYWNTREEAVADIATFVRLIVVATASQVLWRDELDYHT